MILGCVYVLFRAFKRFVADHPGYTLHIYGDGDEKPVLEDGFARIEENTSPENRIGTYTVSSVDIDLGGHMNNVAYVRMIARLFSSAEWNALQIEEAEAVYRAQCFEKEILSVYREEDEKEMRFTVTKENGDTAFQMRIVKGNHEEER